MGGRVGLAGWVGEFEIRNQLKLELINNGAENHAGGSSVVG